MKNLINEVGIENSIVILLIINVILLIAMVIAIVKILKLNKKYNVFIKKLGNGKNIEEDLETYMYRVEKVEKQNLEIVTDISDLNKVLRNCIQKVGIVRYSAFKDTGSDLSFALALLDESNNGVVLNGIYSREMSNIYAKPVKNGKSTYTLSDEEQEALQKAINQDI